MNQAVNDRVARWILAKEWLPQKTIAAALVEVRQQPGHNLLSFLSARGLLSHSQTQELMTLAQPAPGNVPAPAQAAAPYYSQHTPNPTEELYYSQSTSHAGDESPTANLIKPTQGKDYVAPAQAQARPQSQSQVVVVPYTPGQQFGNYVIESEISRGGMGTVVKAFHRGMAVHRALKFLINPNPTEAEVKRFQIEAAVLANLEHPNVLRVTDFGYERGYMFFAMELIEGRDLHALVQESYKTRRIPPEEAWLAKIWAAMANAMAYCHSQGVIHRDIKPQNILIESRDQRPVLCDFGLIKRLGNSDLSTGPKTDHSLTKTGEVWGTLNFMSPEQLCTQGEFGEVSPATDVWGMGATFFFSITGHYPYAEDNVLDLFNAFKSKEPRGVLELNPDATPWFAVLCGKCLQRQPEDRISLPEIIQFIEAQLGPQLLPPLPSETNAEDESKEESAPEIHVSSEHSPSKNYRWLILASLFVLVAPSLAIATYFSLASPRLIDLQSPRQTSAEYCLVSGKANTGNVQLRINESPIRCDSNGYFSTRVYLSEGENQVSVKFDGSRDQRVLTIVRDITDPELKIDGSESQSVFFISDGKKRITGTIIDQTPLSLTVNGKEEPFSGTGQFAFDLPKVDSGKALIFNIEARDKVEHSTRRKIVILPPKAYRYALMDRLWWNQASTIIQEEIAKDVSRKLGEEFVFKGFKMYECGGQKHRIASYLHTTTNIMFRLIPGGEFLMGVDFEKANKVAEKTLLRDLKRSVAENQTEPKAKLEEKLESYIDSYRARFLHETPRRKVTLRPYLIAHNELTNKQWRALYGKATVQKANDNHPLTYHTRGQILKMLLRSKTGLRLPSEAEWEYACRAGSTSLTFWGSNEIDPRYCQIKYQGGVLASTVSETQEPNAFGLFNMVGNAFEWVADDYYDSFKGAPTDGQPRRIKGADKGVVRGAYFLSWNLLECRSSHRQHRQVNPGGSSHGNFPYVGCRLAFSIPGY
ncbi:MAG: protein kinase [Planctomycetota bacterium]|nr:protein kinase [Planctomycetota bacterium]